MALAEEIYAQALVLAGPLRDQDKPVLEKLCAAAERSLAGRLREDITPEDCKEDFVLAAGLYALGLLAGVNASGEAKSFTVGEISVTPQNGENAAKCLMVQAGLILGPYMKDGFCFRGV